MMKPVVFIDGEAGTTGIQIRDRLAGRDDIALLSLPDAERKRVERRADALNACDVAILCLPDDAAREAVSLIRNPAVRVIDASTAHRTHPDWVYGFAELTAGHAGRIAASRRVSNPGCYATGAIAVLRPLVERGLVSADFPALIHAVSGYSGAGVKMIDAYENPVNPGYIDTPVRGYGFALKHKHVPEIQLHSGLSARPIFLPMIGRYRQGILLSVGLHFSAMAAGMSGERVHAELTKHYARAPHVALAPLHRDASFDSLEPESLNGTDDLHIHIFANDAAGQCVIAAVFDNLGKGASGAAVQNLDLMLTGAVYSER
ncbi:N-acetyl-gamma-glutamyl-phosphate reductase [Burkholderia singularis]|uniref:N-acetyl-gamma-glutamyl-phosphate reductase n=1 Tax=Burkholderia singularis TaxID=1503053 RepID=A0A103E6I8_9BURK|nr:N-acetyl-gamma-glutamyl-phosphate reductase [Burkholderia singularis]KVE29285.1 N-acetyl-gamma-glutamyl-phosphate reductase [Burkholderia singularis]SMF99751.1 N-acetyl-gamma-glutamyl-phosphate reductase [Burkholderia singularis]